MSPHCLLVASLLLGAWQDNIEVWFWLYVWLSEMHFVASILTLTYALGFISVPITLNEKVEMTVNKFAMRVVGNALGSSVGFAIMLSEPVASNPYAIVVRCLRPLRQQAVCRDMACCH